jgi:hypothetical protein
MRSIVNKICLCAKYKKNHSCVRPEMNGLSDSITIGILLTLVFAAVAFYLYSRMSQNEKRVGLLENLLLSLKMETEASLDGPDTVEAISSPVPLTKDEIETIDEESYADILQNIPTPTTTPKEEEKEKKVDDSVSAEDFLRSIPTPTLTSTRVMDANYESMSVKELQALARQKGLTNVPKTKRDLIDALKKQGGHPPATDLPIDSDHLQPGEESGYTIEEL